MSQVVGTQKFAAIEVVDYAKFDNEVVFDSLTMAGNDLEILGKGSVTITVSGDANPTDGLFLFSDSPMGVRVHSNGTGAVDLMAGNVDSVPDVTGYVNIGSVNVAGVVQPVLKAGWDGVAGALKLGAFGTTPVIKQTGASAAGIAAIADAPAKAAVLALQTALANYGLVTSPV